MDAHLVADSHPFFWYGFLTSSIFCFFIQLPEYPEFSAMVLLIYTYFFAYWCVNVFLYFHEQIHQHFYDNTDHL